MVKLLQVLRVLEAGVPFKIVPPAFVDPRGVSRMILPTAAPTEPTAAAAAAAAVAAAVAFVVQVCDMTRLLQKMSDPRPLSGEFQSSVRDSGLDGALALTNRHLIRSDANNRDTFQDFVFSELAVTGPVDVPTATLNPVDAEENELASEFAGQQFPGGCA